MVRAREACWNVSPQGGGDVKLESSPRWNLARAERSRLCIYAFVEGPRRDKEVNDRIDPIANIHKDFTLVSSTSSVKRVDDYARSPVRMELDLAPGESRGYWKYHTPENGSSKQKRWARSTMRKPRCCSIPALKCRSSILPLLVR